MAEVSVRNVVKAYEGGVLAVRGIDLEIADEEFVVLVGPSGCGKSTTLRMIAGLEEISDGEIWIGGDVVNDVPPKDRDIAMVFQNYALYPHMTVFDNMAFGLKLRGATKADIKSRVDEAARILDIVPLLGRKPKALSGGQRQRVAMGRAIVRHPKVFLFDEPLSNLDAKLRVQMRTEIKKVHQTVRTTTVYVTHDQVEAMTLADRVVVMNGGVIEQVGPPQELYHHPKTRFVAGFIGSPAMNFLPVTLEQRRGPAGGRPGAAHPRRARRPLRRPRQQADGARPPPRAHERGAPPRLGPPARHDRRGGADGHGDPGPLLRPRRPHRRPHRPRDPGPLRPGTPAPRRHEQHAPDGAGHRGGRLTMEGIAGQVAWITGAGSGIGRAMAIAFARAGCRVAITGRRRDALEETAALMPRATPAIAAADVSDPAAVAKAHQAVAEALGDVDILVNNAGTNARRRHWRDLSPEDMASVVDVNLKGPFLCALAVLPAMRARRRGLLIHTVSNAATGIYPVSGPSYTASKHGARAMSATINAEEGIHGIRSVCINPGEVETPILDTRPRPPSAEDRALMAQPEDIAAAAVFAAQLPPRTCMAEMLINPTDNNFYRAIAQGIAGMGG